MKKTYIQPVSEQWPMLTRHPLLDILSIEVDPGTEGNQEEAEGNKAKLDFEEDDLPGDSLQWGNLWTNLWDE